MQLKWVVHESSRRFNKRIVRCKQLLRNTPSVSDADNYGEVVKEECKVLLRSVIRRAQSIALLASGSPSGAERRRGAGRY